MLRQLWSDEDATTTLEYALLLLLVALSGFVAWQALGRATESNVDATSSQWPEYAPNGAGTRPPGGGPGHGHG